MVYDDEAIRSDAWSGPFATLRPPPASLHRLHRPSTSRVLDQATTRPLTLVVSPPGTGKTATIAAWSEETDLTTHWLSFEGVRDDHRAIVLAFLDSIAAVYPAVGQRAFTVFQSTWALEQAVRVLIDDLATVERTSDAPVVLVIDDLHRVDHDTELLDALTLLVSHLPEWLHLVLTTRREPTLPLDRLRARGMVGEVRYPELRLSDDEACELLAAIAPSMPDDEARAAATRSDGWAAYLQMTATAASRSAGAPPGDGRRSVDPDELIEEYIWHELLADEPPELVDALSVLAVASRANAELAVHLLDDPRAANLLSHAEHRGLFVLRAEERWYTMHPLVREVLRADLERRDPARHERARVRLAQWYEDRGDVVGALERWLDADQPREALRLLALHHADLYDTGHEAVISGIIEAIPPHVVTSDSNAPLELAWCHLLTDRREFVDLVDRAVWWTEQQPFDERVEARLAILRSMAATMQGDHRSGGTFARQALDRFGANWWGDPIGRFGWNMVAREIALSERWDDSSDEVRMLDLELGRDPRRRLTFEGTRALGEALSGHPADALRNVAGVRRAAEVVNMTILRAELGLAEALALREIGDRQRALRMLEEIASTPAETMLVCRVIAAVELVHAHVDRNDRTAARAALHQAQQLIESETFIPDGHEWLTVASVRLALANGDADTAHQRAARLTDPFWGPASLGRVALAVGDEEAARCELTTAKPRGARQALIHAMLQAFAAETAEEATSWADIAVETAMANGMSQTVAGEGDAAVDRLEQLTSLTQDEWFARVRRAAADVGARTPTMRIDLVEPLTDREWDVIRYLPSRLTVREIASELYVSVNTLKSHMKAVYRKLGVSSRQEAAGVARTMLAARRRDAGTPPENRSPVV